MPEETVVDMTPAPAAPSPAPAPAPTPAPAPAPGPAPSPAPAPAAPVPPPEPKDWRLEVLGELPADAADEARKEYEAMTKLAARYNSPKEVIKALRAANVKISSGSLKTPLAKDATEAQVKEWRDENGIPQKPEDYKLDLGDGVVMGEEDRNLVAGFLQSMHKEHAPPALVNAAVKSYMAMREEEVAAIVTANQETARAAKIELTEEWGPRDFEGNVGGIKAMLAAAGDDVANAFMSAAGADGIKLLAKAPIVRWLAQHARETGYVGQTLTYGTDGGASLTAEMAAIEKRMLDDPNGYYKDTKAQERYQQLAVAKARQAGK